MSILFWVSNWVKAKVGAQLKLQVKNKQFHFVNLFTFDFRMKKIESFGIRYDVCAFLMMMMMVGWSSGEFVENIHYLQQGIFFEWFARFQPKSTRTFRSQPDSKLRPLLSTSFVIVMRIEKPHHWVIQNRDLFAIQSPVSQFSYQHGHSKINEFRPFLTINELQWIVNELRRIHADDQKLNSQNTYHITTQIKNIIIYFVIEKSY